MSEVASWEWCRCLRGPGMLKTAVGHRQSQRLDSAMGAGFGAGRNGSGDAHVLSPWGEEALDV